MLCQTRVPAQQIGELAANSRKQPRKLAHASSDDHPHRSDAVHQLGDAGRQIMGFHVGRRLGQIAELIGGTAPPVLDRRPAGEPLQAIAVVRAPSRVGVVGMAGHAQVSHLRVDQSVHGTAPDERPAADAGSDREIDGVLQSLRRPPPPFAERRPVDVGVDRNGHTQRRGERPDHVGSRPARFRSRRYVPVFGGVRPQFQRSEGGDSECSEGTVAFRGRCEVVDESGDGLLWCRRGEHRTVSQVVRTTTYGTHHLGPACFEATERHRHGRILAHSWGLSGPSPFPRN